LDLTEVEHDPRPLFARLADLEPDDSEHQRLKDQLVTDHLPLARNLARRYANRGETLDDLVQVARLGLVKAVTRFDPTHGSDFTAFAIPTITGELRRHFRDTGWDIRVPRRLQELHLRISAATSELAHRDGHAPTATDLATYLGVPREEIIEGVQAGTAYTARSLDVPAGPDADAPTLAHTLGGVDEGFAAVENHETLVPLLAGLPERERRILGMRFFQDMTQTEIAREIGVSQMHVSRLLTATLARLRAQLLTA
jgi:RNA polymerase sigma-B factor